MHSLNQIYRTIWSEALEAWVAVSEITKSKGKRSASSLIRAIDCSSEISKTSFSKFKLRPKRFLIALACACSLSAHANPIGGTVASGQATFNTSGNTLTVTNTPGTIINWQGFSINANEITKFAQQSATSTVLNRVTSANPSSILGSLQSNGRVFLVNPNGIVFGAGSTVNVAGLVATTLKLSDADFLADNHHYTANANSQNISNAGNLTAFDGGQIYLIAPNVDNSGIITAPNGEILLAAGSSVDLVNSNSPSLSVNITAPAGNATNIGQLVASAGRLGLFGTLVNSSGKVSADSATMQGGKIVFKASQSVVLDAGSITTANNSTSIGGNINITADAGIITGGSISASGLSGGNVALTAGSGIMQYGAINVDGSAGQGGTVTATANTRIIQTAAGIISANGTLGGSIELRTGNTVSDAGLMLSGQLAANGIQQGGSIILTGTNVELLATDIQATGDLAGGSIRIGGSFQGKDARIANATNNFINNSTNINASATSGDGGNVVVWSDTQTIFSGNINATGGLNATNGGSVEVSGKNLGFNGMVNTSTANGLTGNLLLDPANIVIQTGGVGGLSGGAVTLALGKIGTLTELSNGNLVIANSADATVAASSGAVWLFNGITGALISTLTGSTANDQVGLGGVTKLSNGNYVIDSYLWNNGAVLGAGAVTWGSATTGVTGTVSGANSLVGSSTNDLVGSYGLNTGPNPSKPGVFALSNGNYVVNSTLWANSTVLGAGAVTWGNGTTGTVGAVSAANSLVGSSTNDNVGAITNVSASMSGITLLNNGNYVVSSSKWANGAVMAAGAVTWGDGATAGTRLVGTISTANSLVGTTANDQVGSGVSGLIANGVTALNNGNYVVTSPNWNNVTILSVGAVTWGNGLSGTVGAVSATNSLVGSVLNDQVGFGGVTALSNGNYVVDSYMWNNGAALQAGAATWGDGATAGVRLVGAVSALNSLVGSAAFDNVGYIVTALTNGNYVVASPFFKNALVAGSGAVTWGNGLGGTVGAVSAANSLVSDVANTNLGSASTIGPGVIALSNGNYVVVASGWTNSIAGLTGVGAVTWGDGATAGVRLVGNVSAANSLVGSTAGDAVGNRGVTVLNNGNYVVSSQSWSNGVAFSFLGAVTWGNGLGGTVGAVSATNSLVGSTTGDWVGSYQTSNGVTALSNGNYVVNSTHWANGAALLAGAVTWGNGLGGTVGAVSATNSLVGSVANDQVGIGGVTALSNGNYVASNFNWNNGAVSKVGAVTWGNGVGGTVGAVSTTNSLVGSTANDQVGAANGGGVLGGVIALSNGNYLVNNGLWKTGVVSQTGAVTLGNGTTGTVGTVSATNSVVNTSVAGVITSQGLANGNVAIRLATGWSVYSPGVFGVGGGGGAGNPLTYATLTGQTSTIDPGAITAITNTGTAVTLQASNDITVNSAILTVLNGGVTTGGNLNLSAGRSIFVKANIDLAGGFLNLLANDSVANGVVAADRLAGAAAIDTSLATLSAGAINMTNSGGSILAGSMTTTGAINLNASQDITESMGSTWTGVGMTLSAGRNVILTTTNTGASLASWSVGQNGTGGALDLTNWAVTGGSSYAFIGGTGSDTIINGVIARAVTVSGANSGAINGASFSSIENFKGGSGNVSFAFSSTGSLSGTLYGGGTGSITLSSAGTTGAVVNVTGNGLSALIINALNVASLNASGTASISINGALNTGAGAVILSSFGTISEGVGGSITGGALTTSAVGGTSLTGANAVSSFVATDSADVLFLNTATTLTLGAITTGGTLDVENVGALTISAPIAVNGLLTVPQGNWSAWLLSSGANSMITNKSSVTLASGGNGVGFCADKMTLAGFGGSVTAPRVILNTSNPLTLADLGSIGKAATLTLELSQSDIATINSPSFYIGVNYNMNITAPISYTAGDLYLWTDTPGAVGAGSIGESGLGSVTANKLITSAVGGITLGGTNAIGSFSATNITSGNISLTNTATTLTLNAISNTVGSVSVVSSNDIIENSGISLVSNGQSLSAGRNLTLGTINSGSGTAQLLFGQAGAGGILDVTNENFTGPNGRIFTGGTGVDTLKGVPTGSSTILTFTGVDAGNIDGITNFTGIENYDAGGTANINIVFSGGGLSGTFLGRGTGTISASGSTSGAVNVASLGVNPFIVNGLIAGSLTASGMASVALNGALNTGAGIVSLTSTGTISEGASGTITAGLLQTSGIGGTTLNGVNTIGSFNATNSTGGAIAFTNTGALTITGISNTDGGADTVINTGSINITGTISAVGGGAINLTETLGAITESGSGLINTSGLLTMNSVTGETLNGANKIGSLAATNTSSGDIALFNTSAPFTINNVSNTGGNLVFANTGGIIIAGAMNTSGGLKLTAHSPITINSGGSINAVGDVVLTAGSAGSAAPGDRITINGSIVGKSVMLAGNRVMGNIPAGAIIQVAVTTPAPTVMDTLTSMLAAYSTDSFTLTGSPVTAPTLTTADVAAAGNDSQSANEKKEEANLVASAEIPAKLVEAPTAKPIPVCK